jgi:hypothetical protein
MSKSIHEFKKGDIIIKLGPTIVKRNRYNIATDSWEQVEEEEHSYREPMEFIAIANNLIYLRWVKGYLNGAVSKARLEEHETGWEFFVIPAGLTLEDCA